MAVVVVPAMDNAPAPLIAKPKDGDYVELPAGKEGANVHIRFSPHVGGNSSSVGGSLAFWIVDAGGRCGPLNCLPVVPTEEYALPGIPAGTYRLSAAIWRASTRGGADPAPTPKTLADLRSSFFTIVMEAVVMFHVRRFEAFSPSYEWRGVEPWHKVPPGLEVRLDMGDGGGRLARIPQPWRWDARVEGEAAPRRAEVEAGTKVAEVLARLGVDVSTHEIVWRDPDGKWERILDCSWTAEMANLFGYARDIFVRRRSDDLQKPP
mmetsp:Transcript_102006/g.287982  ORF Transcript_102006/g.287982 Transcript_102006/m.287982 type:complete len:264 (-) Transcript_102006:182-973(-)